MTQQWCVIEASDPKRARVSIQALGIEVFLPEYVVRVRHSRRSELVRKPLLYGYMFARFDPVTDRWQDICSRRERNGVKAIMCSGNRPRRVPDEEIERVRRFTAQFDDIVCEQVPLSLGQAVKIIDGAFSGNAGVIAWSNATPFVGVEMNILGRRMPIPILREYVASAG